MSPTQFAIQLASLEKALREEPVLTKKRAILQQITDLYRIMYGVPS